MKNIVYRKKARSGDEIIIRYPNKNDLNDMLQYINELSRERTFVLLQGGRVKLKYEKKYLEKVLREIRKPSRVQLLLFCDKKLVGISEIGQKNRAQSHVASFGISIRKSARGKGLGGLLMKTILIETKKQLPEVKIVILSTFANNIIAAKLYKKLGFKKYGLLPKGVKHKKRLVDEIFMWKEI